MILYLDTSALVKLFVDEPETATMAKSLELAGTTFTHMITYAETRAALARAQRMGRISAKQLGSYKTELEHFWDDLEVVIPEMALIRRAGDLAERFGLRGYDSLHLAAAEQLAHRSGARISFACFDERLNSAAGALGMDIIKPS
ncbi:MAG: type II toxin-antitoxin system VapC family toxin [Mariprofundaceae bacterium]